LIAVQVYFKSEGRMAEPRVFADFHNADRQGRLRLNCNGTLEDLTQHRVELKEGIPLKLYSEDLEVDGVAHFSPEEKIWVAAIDWNAIEKLKSE
jgi:hypothetical protein